jgi:hypothetical protein
MVATTADRRQQLRRAPDDASRTRVRIRAGRDADVINYSPTGMLLASDMRLLPGRRCVVAWPGMEGRPSACGVVVRSAVGRLDATVGVFYHAAVEFDAPASFLREAASQAG